METIEQEALRASQVARDLLVFARPQPAQRRNVSVDVVVRRVLAVVRHELYEANIELVTNLGEPPVIEADEPQLEQALLNLLRNARDAMAEDGGSLSVTTTSEGANVRIELAATGPGVPAEIALRIFEPFVSSYVDGMHQGMGLRSSTASWAGTVVESGTKWPLRTGHGSSSNCQLRPARLPSSPSHIQQRPSRRDHLRRCRDRCGQVRPRIPLRRRSAGPTCR